jgi:molybdopterin molybdotransferase
MKKMISVNEALEIVLKNCHPLGKETISLDQALGRVLSLPALAEVTQPPQNMSAMDGYAVKAEDIKSLPATLTVVGEIPAGKSYDKTLNKGEAVRIFTGGPMPTGADTVVMQENTERPERNGDVVKVVLDSPLYKHVRKKGLDFTKGKTLMAKGQKITARDIGLLAAANVAEVNCIRKPRVAILSTGDELVSVGTKPGPNQIINSNTPMLAAFVEKLGCTPVIQGVAEDTEEALEEAFMGLKNIDFLLTIGGASVGEYDLVQKVLVKLGLKLDFWKVAMRPGKPVLFGEFNGNSFMGLPGNPSSAMVGAVLFLAPALYKLQGIDFNPTTPKPALLEVPMDENKGRQAFIRGTSNWDEMGVRLVRPLSLQDSSALSSMAAADCLIIRKSGSKARKTNDAVTIIDLLAF